MKNWTARCGGRQRRLLLWLCLLSLCFQLTGGLAPNGLPQAIALVPNSKLQGSFRLINLQFTQHHLHLLGNGLSSQPKWQSIDVGTLEGDPDNNQATGLDLIEHTVVDRVGYKRFSVDLPKATLSSNLPTDAQLTEQLRQQWHGFYSIQVVSTTNGLEQGLRLIIDVSGDDALPRAIVCGRQTVRIANSVPQDLKKTVMTATQPKVTQLTFSNASPKIQPSPSTIENNSDKLTPDISALTLLAIQSLPVMELMPLRLTKHVAFTNATHSTVVKAKSTYIIKTQKPHPKAIVTTLQKPFKVTTKVHNSPSLSVTTIDLTAQRTISQQQHHLNQLTRTVTLLNQQLQHAKVLSQQTSVGMGLKLTPIKSTTIMVNNPSLLAQVARQANSIKLLTQQLRATNKQLSLTKTALSQTISHKTVVPIKPLANDTTLGLITSLNTTKQQLSQAMAVITKQRQQLDQVKLQIKLVLEEVNTTHREQMTHLLQKLEVAEADLKSMRASQSQLSENPASPTELLTERDNLKIQLAQSNQANQQLNQQWDSLKQQYSILQDKLNSLKQPIQQQAITTPSSQPSVTPPVPSPEAMALKAHIIALDSVKTELEQSLKQAQQVAASLQVQLAPLKAQNQSLLSQNLNLHNALNHQKEIASVNAMALVTPPAPNPVVTTPVTSVITLLEQANVLEQRQQVPQAISLLRQGLNTYPKDRQLQATLGKLYLKQGELAQADAVLTQSLDPEGISNYAITLKKLGQLDKAETLLKLTLTLVPTDPTVHYNLGNIYLAKQQLLEAQEQLQQAINLKPDFAEAYYQLGLVFAKQNNAQQASMQWKRFIQLAPNNPKVVIIRPILKQLESPLKMSKT
jgi:tetratricopeptide (TPR) repeat protein